MFYGIIHEGKFGKWLWNKVANNEYKEYQKRTKDKEKVFDSLDAKTKAKVRELLKEKEKEFESLGKSELKKLLTPAYKEKILKAIAKGLKSSDLDPADYKEYKSGNKLPKLGFVQEGPGFDIILNEGQEMNLCIGFICKDMAKILSKITGYTISCGDEDEGGIIVEEFYSLSVFYQKIYLKETKEK